MIARLERIAADARFHFNHRLHQLGTTFSIVDADADPASICAAIAAGRVRVESAPLGWLTAVRTMTELVADEWLPWKP